MPAEQQSHIYVGGSWRAIDEVFVYQGGSWKRVNEAFVRHSSAWRRFYAFDATNPTVSSFTLLTLTSGSTYGPSTTTVSYSLVFSEPVTGLATSDFTFIGTSTTWSISSVTNPSSDEKTYVVQATSSGAPTTGTVQIRLSNNSVSDIVDGNPLNLYTSGPANSPSINIDATKPSVSSFSSASNTTTRTPFFTLTFSEAVTGLTSADFTIGGTSTGWSIGTITGSGTTYTVNLVETSTGSSTTGTLNLTMLANGVTDAYANTGPASNSTSNTINVVRAPTAAPTVTMENTKDVVDWTWSDYSASLAITSYQYSVSTNGGAYPANTPLTNPSTWLEHTGSITNTLNTSTYKLRVRGCNADGCGPYGESDTSIAWVTSGSSYTSVAYGAYTSSGCSSACCGDCGTQLYHRRDSTTYTYQNYWWNSQPATVTAVPTGSTYNGYGSCETNGGCTAGTLTAVTGVPYGTIYSVSSWADRQAPSTPANQRHRMYDPMIDSWWVTDASGTISYENGDYYGYPCFVASADVSTCSSDGCGYVPSGFERYYGFFDGSSFYWLPC